MRAICTDTPKLACFGGSIPPQRGECLRLLLLLLLRLLLSLLRLLLSLLRLLLLLPLLGLLLLLFLRRVIHTGSTFTAGLRLHVATGTALTGLHVAAS